jgi:arylsulfatase A-like enzyme
MELKIPNVDGRSLKGALLEGSPLEPRPFVVANFGSEAMIDWPWKIVREGSLPITPDFLKSDAWHLYNIESDPGEVVNLREKFPQRFERMRNNLLQIPRRESVQFSTDGSWDTFGGHETRAPWAEAAGGYDDN